MNGDGVCGRFPDCAHAPPPLAEIADLEEYTVCGLARPSVDIYYIEKSCQLHD